MPMTNEQPILVESVDRYIGRCTEMCMFICIVFVNKEIFLVNK